MNERIWSTSIAPELSPPSPNNFIVPRLFKTSRAHPRRETYGGDDDRASAARWGSTNRVLIFPFEVFCWDDLSSAHEDGWSKEDAFQPQKNKITTTSLQKQPPNKIQEILSSVWEKREKLRHFLHLMALLWLLLIPLLYYRTQAHNCRLLKKQENMSIFLLLLALVTTFATREMTMMME